MTEGNPGHHFQSAYSLEKQDWPLFRKVMEDRIYSQAPSRFPINTAYVEVGKPQFSYIQISRIPMDLIAMNIRIT